MTIYGLTSEPHRLMLVISTVCSLHNHIWNRELNCAHSSLVGAELAV